MRIVGTMLLWVVGAVLCVAIVIALTQWFPLADASLTVERKLNLVLNGLINRSDFLAYGAIAGAVLALISLVPHHVRAGGEKLIFWGITGAISGAISVACALFLYKGYLLYARGVSPDSMPLPMLLFDEMGIDRIWPYGAIAGGAWAIILVVLSLVRESELREAQRALSNAPASDPDTMIRAQRSQRAQQYLSERRHREGNIGTNERRD